MYYGDIRLGDTIDIKFTTRQISGAPSTLSSSPVISAYVGNSTTEITAGITLTVDFDSRTGLNNVRVVASSGNGFATATNVQLVITTGTVNSVSVVGEVIGTFSIEARSALMPATAGRTLVVDAAGLADANTVKVGPTGSGSAQTARDIGASVLLSAGTGTGQLDFTSGVVKANLAQILGTALTETAGQIAAGFKKFFNIATPASTMDALTLVATATNLTNAPTAGDFTATMKTSIGTAVAASAVASVTGNVGGNVTGSVGSVVGAVGSVTGSVGSVVGAVGSVTGNVGGNVTGSVGSVVGLTASNLDATVSSRLATSGYTTPPTANDNADALLGRNVAGGSSTGRLVKEALYVLRNKTEIVAGTLNVYGTDDSTLAFDAAVSTTAGNPISSIDPS